MKAELIKFISICVLRINLAAKLVETLQWATVLYKYPTLRSSYLYNDFMVEVVEKVLRSEPFSKKLPLVGLLNFIKISHKLRPVL